MIYVTPAVICDTEGDFYPREHLTMSGDICSCQSLQGGVLRAYSGQSPEMLLDRTAPHTNR